MDEIIKEVIARTGLPEDKARAAADTVIGFLKAKLPEPAAGMLSEYLAGGQASSGNLAAQAAHAVEGFFKKS